MSDILIFYVSSSLDSYIQGKFPKSKSFIDFYHIIYTVDETVYGLIESRYI